MYSDSDLERLVAAMRANQVSRLEIKRERGSLRLQLPEELCVVALTEPTKTRLEPVKSPDLGRFLPCNAAEGVTPPVPGQPVQKMQILGYVEDGPLRVPLIAPAAGILVRALCEEGQVVGHGDVLFEIEVKE